MSFVGKYSSNSSMILVKESRSNKHYTTKGKISSCENPFDDGNLPLIISLILYGLLESLFYIFLLKNVVNSVHLA